MKMASLIMKKLWLENRKFIDSSSLKSICEELGVSYKIMIQYLLARKYLVRIFRGIFYVKSVEEIEFGRLNVSHLWLVARGLEMKGVKNWYFGLYTALRLNGVTHEYFDVDFVLNDVIFRFREVNIAGRKFKFVKIKPSLFFGVKVREGIKYSDLEKTILDFIYLWRYRGIPEEKILLDVSELVESASREKLFRYSKMYPKTVRKFLERIC